MYGAIAYDTSSTAPSNQSGGTSWTHTTSGNDRYLVVATYWDSSSQPTVTYNGVSMDLIFRMTSTNVYVFGLANPASGANTVSVSFGGGGLWGDAIATSYTGVKQTGQPDSTGSKASGNPVTSLAGTTVTVADNSWAIGIAKHGASDLGGTNTSVRVNARHTNADWYALVDGNAPKTPAGTATLTTTGTSQEMQLMVFSLAPAPVALANVKTLNGVAKASVKTRNGVAVASIKGLNGVEQL